MLTEIFARARSAQDPSAERANSFVPSCASSAAILRPTVGWLARSRRAATAKTAGFGDRYEGIA